MSDPYNLTDPFQNMDRKCGQRLGRDAFLAGGNSRCISGSRRKPPCSGGYYGMERKGESAESQISGFSVGRSDPEAESVVAPRFYSPLYAAGIISQTALSEGMEDALNNFYEEPEAGKRPDQVYDGMGASVCGNTLQQTASGRPVPS